MGLSRARKTARQEIPPELRRDVRLLGQVLGNVIADYGGVGLLRDVERLRRLVIRARDEGRFERDAERLVASWKLERAELVARAFTCYFHLANLAEEHHRARVIRERDRGPSPLPESLAASIAELGHRLGRRRLAQLVSGLEFHPVFTAHPTEARRRAVVTAIRRIGEQLERLDDPRISDGEKVEADRRLGEEVDSLWRTAQMRTAQVQPLDDAGDTVLLERDHDANLVGHGCALREIEFDADVARVRLAGFDHEAVHEARERVVGFVGRLGARAWLRDFGRSVVPVDGV